MVIKSLTTLTIYSAAGLLHPVPGFACCIYEYGRSCIVFCIPFDPEAEVHILYNHECLL